MTTYITNDGEKFEARNAKHLVELMRAASFVPSNNDAEFMIEVAKRAKLLDADAVIPTDNVEHFVATLVKIGFLEKRNK